MRVTAAVLGGVLGLSLIINVIFVVVLATKIRGTSISLSMQSPPSEGEGGKEAMDIEMKPNSLYGRYLTSGRVSKVSHHAAYEDVEP